MLGAVTGDIIGSVYEHYPVKTKDFKIYSQYSRFTDDTVLTVAIADAILQGKNYTHSLERYYYYYPQVPYGAKFHEWASSHHLEPYNSWGNGSAMRVSPVAYICDNLENVLEEAKKSAEVTHNHPEGIKGAQATAAAIWFAKSGSSKEEIKGQIITLFDYDLNRNLDDIRPDYNCDLSCQKTVPEAIICFLESVDFEDSIRNAISLGGDADTMACITGSIAEAYYGIPEYFERMTKSYLDERILKVLSTFYKKFKVKKNIVTRSIHFKIWCQGVLEHDHNYLVQPLK